jgi:Cleaved Adhesin Domain
MSRRAYTTPLLVGMLALTACPGDDVPADTEGTSTGETTEDPTTMTPTTMVDPDSTTTSVDPDDSSSSGEPPPVCEPACGAGECCVGGFCFEAPEPSCGTGCGAFEVCQCPEGSDPCDCVAECVTCGVEGGSYDPCLDVECPEGSFCVSDDPKAPTLAFCAQQDCGTDSCACPLPAEGTTAVPACGAFDGDGGNGSCFLDCSADGSVCPTDMICRTVEGVSACVWPGEGVESDCCFPHGTAGCDDPTCEAAVCGADAFCCDKEWDQICTDSVPGLCPGLCPGGPDPEPQYGDCINGGPCDAGLVCLSDAGMTLGWCGTLNCADDVPCQPPPGTGDAPAICAPLDAMTNACALDCSMGQTCPDGMVCFDSAFCVWEEMVPPPPMLPAYGDCADNPVETCQPTEDACITNAGGTAAGCSQSGCAAAGDCPAAPATGNAPVTCGDLGGGNTCYLDCAAAQTCPDGTVCTVVGAGSACLWADDGLLLDEDFELGAFRPGWSLIDVDGFTPDAAVSYVTDAWVVADVLDPGTNFGAYSTSWYAPAGQSNDWLITPQITVGMASMLSWEALAPDPAFPDGYEVRVSTAMPIVADFLANPAIFSIANEADVLTPHMVDLAAAGYMNEAVYIAFRNNSNDEFILLVDNVQVTE